MTAEIAILNKAAVALAADSAVTISAGSDQQKIFDSEDKLFELTCHSPIGVMINNTMNFMEAPLPVLIKLYRNTAPKFESVHEASSHFLKYLDDFVNQSPPRIENDAVAVTSRNLFQLIGERAQEQHQQKLFDPDTGMIRDEWLTEPEQLSNRIADLLAECYNFEIAAVERFIRNIDDAQFIGDMTPSFSDDQRIQAQLIADQELSNASDEQRQHAVNLIEAAMRKAGVGGASTGLVIAGFGSEELFPTLVSFQLFGSFGGRLRYLEREAVDIDRDGEKARVLPFAQREMVERFLYGLDNSIETKISTECNSSVNLISERILGALEMPQEDLQMLRDTVLEAESEFKAGLAGTFDAMRARSRAEIEDMVEFMPKPEMARMAEALINLTSIKRRVSRGFETVGGPIDVAVISKAEGFVWVSRKHYFPRELNERYYSRLQTAPAQHKGAQHDGQA